MRRRRGRGLDDSKSAPADRADTGPLDETEANPVRPYVDLGGVKILPARGPRTCASRSRRARKRVVAVGLDFAESTLQVQPFAAPRSTRPVARDPRADRRADPARRAAPRPRSTARSAPSSAPRSPSQAGDGQPPVTRLARFVGVDGPRWFLRGVIAGDGADRPRGGARRSRSCSAASSSCAARRRCRRATSSRCTCRSRRDRRDRRRPADQRLTVGRATGTARRRRRPRLGRRAPSRAARLARRAAPRRRAARRHRAGRAGRGPDRRRRSLRPSAGCAASPSRSLPGLAFLVVYAITQRARCRRVLIPVVVARAVRRRPRRAAAVGRAALAGVLGVAVSAGARARSAAAPRATSSRASSSTRSRSSRSSSRSPSAGRSIGIVVGLLTDDGRRAGAATAPSAASLVRRHLALGRAVRRSGSRCELPLYLRAADRRARHLKLILGVPLYAGAALGHWLLVRTVVPRSRRRRRADAERVSAHRLRC